VKTRTIALFSILALIALFMVACDFSFSTANIPNAFMSADPDGAQPTTAYDQDDVFYAIVELANAPDETTVTAVWIAVDIDGTDPNTTLDEVVATSGDAVLTFDLANSPDLLWPLGQYRVDIYLNDQRNTSLDFEVK